MQFNNILGLESTELSFRCSFVIFYMTTNLAEIYIMELQIFIGDIAMKDLLDVLLDQNDNDPIVLTDGDGKILAFEQIAVIPYNNNDDIVLYAILKPISEIKGIADDEAVVFKAVVGESGDTILIVERDEIIAIEIFNMYYDIFEEVHKNESK